MEIVYLALGAIAVIIIIVIVYHVVQWRWSKVDKYELQQNSKNKALDLFEKQSKFISSIATSILVKNKNISGMTKFNFSSGIFPIFGNKVPSSVNLT